MGTLFRPFVDQRTYRRLLFLLTAVPLAPLWFALLFGGWLLTLLAAVTPLVVPALLGFRSLTSFAARVELALARELLGTEIHVAEPAFGGRGYWARIRGVLSDRSFWQEQVYLLLRLLLGGAIAIGLASVLAAALGLIGTPITYAFGVNQDVGVWTIDSLPRALAVVPAGLVVLFVWVHLVRPAAALWSTLAEQLFPLDGSSPSGQDLGPILRASLPARAGVYAGLNLLLIAIWAATSRGYFWPEWTLLTLGVPLAIHAWAVLVDGRRGTWLTARGLGLPIASGAAATFSLFFVAVWAVTTRAYFWPVWPIIGFAFVVLVWAALAFGRGRAALARRIDVLTATRSGAVDVAGDELRRIERDLHDGAQARLVALGMSLGMAEQKLAADPAGARELLAEARAGAGAALKELRDLARGIHPPILADRGLEAALTSLAAGSSLPVEISSTIEARPAAAAESALYFVAAEALANAAKHAGASHVAIRIERSAGQLSVEVADDGRGGAEPAGPGLSGIRRRVEALDGTLAVTSPPGGPTVVKAVLPCAS